MKYNRLLPILIPVIVTILFEWYFFSHRMIYVSLSLVNLAIFFSIQQFIKDSSANEKWWNLIIAPSVLSISMAMYSVLLTSKTAVQALFFVYLVFLYLYLKSLYYYLTQPAFFEKNSLENLSSIAAFFSSFFFFSAAFGFASFLNAPVTKLVLLILMFVCFVSYQFFFINKIDTKSIIFYVPLISLVIVEIAWSAFFLPINFNIVGLSLAICFYVIINLTKHHLRGDLDKNIIKRYVLFGALGLFFLFLTSRWM